MIDASKTSALIPERPVVLPEGSALGQTIDQVYRQMDELDLSTGGQVFALYGGRGTGKTSALLTLLATLRTKNQERADKSKPDRDNTTEWLVPISLKKIAEGNADEPVDSPRQLFAPEYSRAEDDLLFMLLAYLERRYQPSVKEANDRGKISGKGTPLARIHHAEVRRRMPGEFFSFEKDACVSSKDLPRRLVRTQVRVASTTYELNLWFGRLIGSLTESERRLVLLVDDLDLQPQRALDLLEMVQLFLLHPRVIVVLAADKELLLHSVATSLQRRDAVNLGATSTEYSHYQRLAQALLRKWIPIEFPLPRPFQRQRWEFVPLSIPNVPPLGQRIVADFWSTANERFPGDDSLEQNAQEMIGPLLPDTYRGLVHLHNRLTLFDQLSLANYGVRLNLTKEMVAPFWSLLLCSDVSFPDLGLLNLAEEFERDFIEELTALVPNEARDQDNRKENEEGERRDTLPNRTPLLSGMLRTLLPLQLRKAQQHLASIASSWKRLGSEGDLLRFLAISLNANMLERGQSLLNEATYDRIDHLDLTEFAKGVRATPQGLQSAREKCLEELPGLVLGDTQQEVRILAQAQLPLLLWIGFKLRYLRRVTLYMASSTRFETIKGPAGQVFRPSPERQYQWLRPDPVATTQPAGPPSPPDDAVVIIDFLARSQLSQIDQFHDKDQNPLHPKVRARMVPVGDVSPLASDHQLREVLTDVLQYLYELQNQGIQRFHLGLIGPDVLAFFLGQQLNAWTISLYEYYSDQSQYQYVFDLSE